jgi:hypothetical protein
MLKIPLEQLKIGICGPKLDQVCVPRSLSLTYQKSHILDDLYINKFIEHWIHVISATD